MIAVSLTLAALSSGLLILSGYLLGSRREGRERQRLQRELAERTERIAALSTVEGLLASARVPERIGQAVSRLRAERSGRATHADLPRLLDTIAEQGAFTAVLLTDETGLPIASSTQARHAEQLAGIASLILTLAERIVANQQPAPLAVLLRDESNQLVLHRVFRLPFTEERFILTAVAKGTTATPDLLDPALGALEELLAPSEQAA
jgi:predicted regulator of Ras-like GTPase activity (Roadblock/LC7/MglB family)